MAVKKFKMTGFARFFIAMLFLVPLAYIGASYYNGEDGLQNIKNLFQRVTGGASSDTKSIDAVDSTDKTEVELKEEKERLEREIKQKNKKIEELNRQLEEEQ